VGPEERKFCSVSVGIAMYPQHGTCFSELYRKADTALYQAKYSGKNRCVLYEESSSPQFWDHSAGP
jgi:diguanylate cyclase (GGDEF)-like protein